MSASRYPMAVALEIIHHQPGPSWTSLLINHPVRLHQLIKQRIDLSTLRDAMQLTTRCRLSQCVLHLCNVDYAMPSSVANCRSYRVKLAGFLITACLCSSDVRSLTTHSDHLLNGSKDTETSLTQEGLSSIQRLSTWSSPSTGYAPCSPHPPPFARKTQRRVACRKDARWQGAAGDNEATGQWRGLQGASDHR